jgi:alkaline phosphatase D
MTPRSLDAWLATTLTRRSLLTGGLAVLAAPHLRAFTRAAHARELRWQSTPFSLGVASGDPTPDGVVLWTRLAVDPLNGGGMPAANVDVAWTVADDEKLTRVVRRGTATARPEAAHSVHVEVEGLNPGRTYWYQFRAGDDHSPIGRTRTLPRAGAAVDRLRFGFCSCQHYETGYFTPLRHMAAEDLELVFHLGDYIYEGPGADKRPRKHTGLEIMTLADYRNRHALYKTDPDLQAAHAAFPWIVTWDDHEVENNYAGDISEQRDPVEMFLVRRAAAYQAYYEHMPLRRASIPKGPAMQLYRQFSYGDLASFFVLDERQYRTDQPCGDGNKPVCAESEAASGSLLGARQERWLLEGLDRSRSRWNVLPQQVMMARADRAVGPEVRYSMDQWPGYEAQRRRILDFFATHKPGNPIVLTGDIHTNWVNNLVANPLEPTGPAVGTEFVVTSITSGGDGTDAPANLAGLLSENPFVKFHNAQRGYVSAEITRERMRADYQVVPFVSKPDAPKSTRASFVVETGRPGAVTA